MSANLKTLEQNTWAEKVNVRGFSKFLNGTRIQLFYLLDVPKNITEQLTFMREFIEVNDQTRTVESLRQFNSLPKWLKKRMKYRLKHISDFPSLNEFINTKIS